MSLPSILPEYKDMSVEDKLGVMGIAITDLKNKSDIYNRILITGDPPSDPAIPERVRNLETFRRDFQYWFRILIGALIIQTVAFGYGIFVAVVKFLPVIERLATQQGP